MRFRREIEILMKKASAGTINDVLFGPRKPVQSTLPWRFKDIRPAFKRFLGRGVLADKASSADLEGVIGFDSRLPIDARNSRECFTSKEHFCCNN